MSHISRLDKQCWGVGTHVCWSAHSSIGPFDRGLATQYPVISNTRSLQHVCISLVPLLSHQQRVLGDIWDRVHLDAPLWDHRLDIWLDSHLFMSLALYCTV